MNTLTIGILGGMGPRATVNFEQRLLDAFSGADQDFPRIISVNNSQIPDRSDFIQSKGSDPLEEFKVSASILQSSNVDIVCMPCNTAHSPKILARLMATIPLPIIDMPAACILLAESKQYKKILILSTEGTANSGIFDSRAITVTCVYPDKISQTLITSAIKSIKDSGGVDENTANQIKVLIASANVDAVVLACTELSLLPKVLFKSIPLIDSIEVMVELCVNMNTTLNATGE